jgi:uncharacterized protein YdhG (YjbR/CyaY superfamily)
MPKIAFESVADYIAQQPEHVQPVLRRVRAIIRKAVPKAEELISYNIPTFKLNGVVVLYLAGWKQHFALYPITDSLLKALEGELAPHKSHKGTIRFSLDEPVPAKLIERIAKVQAKAAAEQAKTKKRRA